MEGQHCAALYCAGQAFGDSFSGGSAEAVERARATADQRDPGAPSAPHREVRNETDRWTKQQWLGYARSRHGGLCASNVADHVAGRPQRKQAIVLEAVQPELVPAGCDVAVTTPKLGAGTCWFASAAPAD